MSESNPLDRGPTYAEFETLKFYLAAARAEIERYKAALREIASETCYEGPGCTHCVAREALSAHEEKL